MLFRSRETRSQTRGAPGPVRRDGDGRRVCTRRPQQALLRGPGAGRGCGFRASRTAGGRTGPGTAALLQHLSARRHWLTTAAGSEHWAGPRRAGIHRPSHTRTEHEPGTESWTEPAGCSTDRTWRSAGRLGRRPGPCTSSWASPATLPGHKMRLSPRAAARAGTAPSDATLQKTAHG